MTKFLIALNTIAFIAFIAVFHDFTPEHLVVAGAMYPPDAHWYSFISANFLHSGYEHFLTNMVMLYIVGMTLEKHITRGQYIFLVSIIGLFTMTAVYYLNTTIVTVGASGIIFGLMTALLILTPSWTERVWIAILVGINLYQTFNTTDVSQVGHVAGALAGLVAILIKVRQSTSNKD